MLLLLFFKLKCLNFSKGSVDECGDPIRIEKCTLGHVTWTCVYTAN